MLIKTVITAHLGSHQGCLYYSFFNVIKTLVAAYFNIYKTIILRQYPDHYPDCHYNGMEYDKNSHYYCTECNKDDFFHGTEYIPCG